MGRVLYKWTGSTQPSLHKPCQKCKRLNVSSISCNAHIPLKENQHGITHIYTQCMQASIDIVYTSYTKKVAYHQALHQQRGQRGFLGTLLQNHFWNVGYNMSDNRKPFSSVDPLFLKFRVKNHLKVKSQKFHGSYLVKFS